MKRMYVVLSVMILFSLWMLQALGQKVMGTPSKTDQSQSGQLRRHMELREEMHKRLRDKLINGVGSDQDLFEGMEQMMNESFADSFATMDSISDNGPAMKMDWSETSIGRTLIISPDDPAQKIDLDVKNNLITIKGEIKTQTQAGTSMRSFQNSFPVPNDCDGSKVKIAQKDGKISLSFPFKGSKPTPKPVQKDTRIPIKPTGDEVAI